MRGTSDRRRLRTLHADALSRRALRPTLGAVCLVCIPVMGAVLLASRTVRPDLSDLTPKTARFGAYAVLAWYRLERANGALRADGVAAGDAICALGYMMRGAEPVRDGQVVERFILLPEAGNAFHPAHRFGDQRIAVRLQAGLGVPFNERALVWVWGTLRILRADPAGDTPVYELVDARTAPGNNADVSTYFR